MTEVPAEREQPYEVPYREVLHDEDGDDVDGFDLIAGMGTATKIEWWGTDTDEREWRKEMRRKEKARRELGGFGFQS